MVRSRGKGKKQITVAAREDLGSVVEEMVPVKRRGRPLKILKNENQVNNEPEKVEEEEESETNGVLSDQSIKPQFAAEKGRKRRRPSRIEESHEMIKNQIGVETKINSTDSIRPVVGFRQIGSRRKNKPRRAAEVGVECQ